MGGALPLKVRSKREKWFGEIIKSAKGECPKIMPTAGMKRKVIAQTKEKNLLERAKYFYRIRSYLMTSRKQGHSALDQLTLP